jgi:hypothetical protein
LRKSNVLYLEFVETGWQEKLGYQSPDITDRYPQFYRGKAEPHRR